LPAINVTRSRSSTIVVTPAAGSPTINAITPAHPKKISGITMEREVIEFTSLTVDQIRRILGEKKFELIEVTCLYFKSEFTALKSCWDNNRICSTVITKPTDIANTANTGQTITITGGISKIVTDEISDETSRAPDVLVFTIAADEFTFA
jgi:hypothetical protein